MVPQVEIRTVYYWPMDSIFTKIIRREIPAEIIYEDDLVLAFLDINPINHGHTLVVTKAPFENIFDGTPDILGHMMKVGQKIGLALRESNLADGVNIIMNNGKAAQQEVWHAHLHIIPRKNDDNAYAHTKHVTTNEEQDQKTGNILRSHL
jgi:histidine triad (HIT) family protein